MLEFVREFMIQLITSILFLLVAWFFSRGAKVRRFLTRIVMTPMKLGIKDVYDTLDEIIPDLMAEITKSSKFDYLGIHGGIIAEAESGLNRLIRKRALTKSLTSRVLVLADEPRYSEIDWRNMRALERKDIYGDQAETAWIQRLDAKIRELRILQVNGVTVKFYNSKPVFKLIFTDFSLYISGYVDQTKHKQQRIFVFDSKSPIYLWMERFFDFLWDYQSTAITLAPEK